MKRHRTVLSQIFPLLPMQIHPLGAFLLCSLRRAPQIIFGLPDTQIAAIFSNRLFTFLLRLWDLCKWSAMQPQPGSRITSS